MHLVSSMFDKWYWHFVN